MKTQITLIGVGGRDVIRSVEVSRRWNRGAMKRFTTAELGKPEATTTPKHHMTSPPPPKKAHRVSVVKYDAAGCKPQSS